MDVMDQQQRHGRNVCPCVYKTVDPPCLCHHGILRIRLHSFPLPFVSFNYPHFF